MSLKPPEAPAVQDSSLRAVLTCPPTTLRRRADFLRAARGKRAHSDGFVLQAYRRPEGESEGIRVGFTCSKKVGNAVARNRAKRRLREIARLVLPEYGATDYDYVLIGRKERTAARDFAALQDDLRTALIQIHGPRR